LLRSSSSPGRKWNRNSQQNRSERSACSTNFIRLLESQFSQLQYATIYAVYRSNSSCCCVQSHDSSTNAIGKCYLSVCLSVCLSSLTASCTPNQSCHYMYLFLERTAKNRNAFFGTWYLPHSHVHSEQTVPKIMTECIALHGTAVFPFPV